MKRTLHFALLFSFACAAIAGITSDAQAQRMDFGFAVSGMDAPGALSADSNHSPVSLTGGAYLGFNGDVILWHNLGFGGEINWKASQGNYANLDLGYRPIFWNFNAVYSPRLMSHVYLDLVGGIGGESTHYYVGQACGIGCTNYASVTHFDGDFGAGLKLVAHHGIFIRPEVREYLIHNNQEFSSNRSTRYGATLGFTFR